MKYLLLGIFFVFTVSLLSAQDKVIYDQYAVKRNVEPFTAIKISGGIDLYLSPSEEEALAVSAGDEKTRDAIVTKVENGVLQIYSEQNAWKIMRGVKKRVAYVSCKTLNSITASGSSDVAIFGALKGDEVSLNLSGASGFKGKVNVNKLKLDLSGASESTISGQTIHLDIEIGGASKVRAYELESENCKAKASGASDVRVNVKKEISANASGASSIYYKGDATMSDSKTSGASSVGKRG